MLFTQTNYNAKFKEAANNCEGRFQESYYVLDGAVEIKTEDGTYMAEKGNFTEIPLGGLTHFFKTK